MGGAKRFRGGGGGVWCVRMWVGVSGGGGGDIVGWGGGGGRGGGRGEGGGGETVRGWRNGRATKIR